jgi:F-type H+-transporting ATPase subunit gamma
MASIREIRRRIRSVKNTAKITKAMEMVAASKMRRAQQRVIAARPYAQRMRDVLGGLAAAATASGGEAIHPLLVRREAVGRVEIIHMAADRGLCGGFNANLNRRAASFILEQTAPTSIIAVGRRGRDFMVRLGQDLRADFTLLPDYPTPFDSLPIARVAMDDYLNGFADRVYIVYPEYVSVAVQRPVVMQLLPIEPPTGGEQRFADYIFEPGPEEVLASLLPRYVEMQVYQSLLELRAGFQSAQMVAMRNATDAANDMVTSLTLLHNKARQESITKELLEISGGAAALTG